MKYVGEDAEEKAALEKIPLNYRLVTWGPITAVLMTFVFYFASQVLAVIGLLAGAITFGGQTIDSIQENSDALSTTAYQFAGNVLVAASLLLLIYVFLKFKKTSFKALGFRGFELKKFVAYGTAGLAIYLTVNVMASVLISIFWPDILNQQQDIGFSRSATGATLIPIFISLVILPPIIEETLCRGFLFGGLRRRWAFVPAVLVTSGLFALAHLPGGDSGSLVWAAVIDTFLLSLVLCWLRERTGSLWAPMLLHGLKNSLAFATIFIFR